MPPGRAPTLPGESGAKKSFSSTRAKRDIFHKVVIYGPGGIGKTELTAAIAAHGIRPFVIDLEDGAKFLDVDCCDPPVTMFDELRAVLHDESIWGSFDAVVLDSLTKAQAMVEQWVLANVKNKAGEYVQSIESFGYGGGPVHVYEAFQKLLGDLDAVCRRGKHVICTAHDCVASVPNPSGEDWIRYEPRLQTAKEGKSSIRLLVKEWCDHMFFVGYDTLVDKEGKAKGAGTRTIYPVERPTHMAKSRSLANPIPYRQGDAELWKQLLNKE